MPWSGISSSGGRIFGEAAAEHARVAARSMSAAHIYRQAGASGALVRTYFAHERIILGSCMAIFVLLAWEGLERGWWASLFQPLLGNSAERLRLKPIFISSPTLVAKAAFRMYFVTGEMWRDLAWSSLGYSLGLALAVMIGMPLGLAAGWYRRLSYAAEPFLSALNAAPQIVFLPLLVIWVGTGITTRIL